MGPPKINPPNLGLFGWRDFREDGKDKRKKLRENNFFECLVGVILGWKN